MTTDILKAPFPYFGGKSKIAPLVWERFGHVQNYVEPFFGSGAVLLGCPWPGHTETVNDADGLLANFWRATIADAETVATYADWPVNEADLHARHRWLVDRRLLVEQLLDDPEWYDAQAAGWWVWGISQWIGTGWCPRSPAGVADVGELNRKLPHVGNAGMGVHRETHAHAELPAQLPMLHGDSGASGRGVHAKALAYKRPVVAGTGTRTHKGLGVHRASLSQKMPHVGAGWRGTEEGEGVHRKSLAQQMPYLNERNGGDSVQSRLNSPSALYAYFAQLQDRLRRTRVCCGDFERILGPSVTWRHGLTAVFLDPPYADDQHAVSYSGGMGVWDRVCRWCEANGANPLLRIALCGYSGTWEAPAGWTAVPWKAHGGYGSQGDGRGRANAKREVVWFSPYCLDLNALPLFAALESEAL